MKVETKYIAAEIMYLRQNHNRSLQDAVPNGECGLAFWEGYEQCLDDIQGNLARQLKRRYPRLQQDKFNRLCGTLD